MTNIREHYIKVICIFAFAFIYFLLLTPEDLTWRNVSYDSPNYLMSAKYLTLSHPSPGAPLFNLLNAGLIRVIPIGTEYFRLALVSILASAATAALLYHITRSLVAPLIWLVSTVVVSQSTVLEVYTLITFMIVLSYWLHYNNHKSWAYLIIGLGLAVHHLIGFVFVVLIAKDYWDTRSIKSLKPALWIFITVPFFFYIPLANREPYLWIGGESFRDYYRYFFSQGGLLGGIALVPPWDFMERIAEFSAVAIASVGIVISIFVLALKKYPDRGLLALVIIISLYYITNLAPQTFTYMTPVVALCAIAIGNYLGENKITFGEKTLLSLGGVLLFANIIAFNIDHSAATQFYISLDNIPPNSIVWSQNRGWEKTTIAWYNMNKGTIIDQVNLIKPFREDTDLLNDLIAAEGENRLFRTVVTDAESYKVTIISTSAQSVMLDYLSLDAPQP